MALFGAGTIWAAQNGTSVLYIDWLDNIMPITLLTTQIGVLYWGTDYSSGIKNNTVQPLEQQGFGVTSVGNVPNDLSGYSIVASEAWFEWYQKIANY